MEIPASPQPFLADILIYPTSRCNLKCRHCYFAPIYDDTPGAPDDEVSCAQICQAVDELRPFGLHSCKFSGGEPFLRTDLLEMCRYMESKKLRIVIETNGTLVTKHDAEVLGQLRPKVFISVSLDGAEARTHEALRQVPGCFHRAVEGLEHLVQAGINVQTIAAVYEENKDELPRIIDLAVKKGARSFKACFVNPVGRGRSVHRIGTEEMLQLDQQFDVYARSAGIAYTTSVPVALQSIRHIMKSCALNCRCNIASTLAILSDGTITICGMGRYVKEFRFGKLGQDNLTELWVNHPSLQFIRNGLPAQLGGICGRCVLKSACLGHCRLDDEYVTLETLFEPYRICAAAEKLGRFPKGRALARSDVVASTVT